MYVVIDHRKVVTSGYISGFAREGLPSLGFGGDEFREWLEGAPDEDLLAVQGFMLGDIEMRSAYPDLIRSHSRAPIIALSEDRSLEVTLELLTAGIDDVVRKPIHVRELAARSDAIWRRINVHAEAPSDGRLKVYFDGRDPEIDDETLAIPRRERRILEYLVKNAGRRISKAQLFNVIYGVFNESVDESVIEGHMSKLRKKLRDRLGRDVIDAKRYLGYRFLG